MGLSVGVKGTIRSGRNMHDNFFGGSFTYLGDGTQANLIVRPVLLLLK